MRNYKCQICGWVMKDYSRPEECPRCGSNVITKTLEKGGWLYFKPEKRTRMLYLREDQALKLLQVCQDCIDRALTPKQKMKALRTMLVVRYFMLNGLSPMELSNARIEDLDPVSCELFLPKRHWKKNCVTSIDRETVRLQIMYSGSHKKGPLIRRQGGGHVQTMWLWYLVKQAARRTNMPNAEAISPLILKRTFAKLFLTTPGNDIGALQKAFSHKHLWSTAHYLRFVMEDVKVEKDRMMDRLADAKRKSVISQRKGVLE